MNIVQVQRNFGIPKENLLFKTIQDKFDKELIKTSGRYHPYDFESKTTLVELKSRRCKYNTYPTSMISNNKLEYANNYPDKKVIFCFNFIDGLYYHIYKRDTTYDIQKFNNRDYCFIPINELIKV